MTQQLNLEIIKEFEGFREEAYRCSSGYLTIGYGTRFYSGGMPVKQGDKMTHARALQYLEKEANRLADNISSFVTVDLNANQLSALVSFAYNFGLEAFRTSTLRKKLNQGDYIGASREFKRWNKNAFGKVEPGLVRRRKAEEELFNS